MAESARLFPEGDDFPGNEARVEYEREIGARNYRDFRVGAGFCWWCGARLDGGKCPNEECQPHLEDEIEDATDAT